MSELEKAAKQLAVKLLNATVGMTLHPTTGKALADMPLEEFQELRRLASMVAGLPIA